MLSNESPTVNKRAWWGRRASLRRFISDLVIDEFRRLRHGNVVLPALPWDSDVRIDRDLGADSLELLSIGTALAEAIHLHESGIEDYLLARRSLGEWTETASQGLDAYSGKITFRTSGSTGVPKPCTHTLASLCQESTELARLFAGRRRILAAVPGHHVYGFLLTVLLAHELGIPDAAVVDVRGSLPSALAQKLQPGDLVIGHPEFWRAVSRAVPVISLDVVGVTSTAPCPNDVGKAVADAGLAGLYQIYGSSETAGIGWRRSHAEPYRLFSYWSRDDMQVDGLIRTHVDGEQEKTTAQDALEWVAPSLFQVGGRRDAGLQVGGVNVFPSKVQALLRRHPDVQDAVVRLMRPDEGNRLKAFIVPKPGLNDAVVLRTSLQAWVESHLPTAARPKAYTFGPKVPVTPSGKTADWPIDSLMSEDWQVNF
jgi:long-chain acyl-CoA synthetase